MLEKMSCTLIRRAIPSYSTIPPEHQVMIGLGVVVFVPVQQKIMLHEVFRLRFNDDDLIFGLIAQAFALPCYSS